MTEYGRGPGSQPWHPEDPLYGEQGWDGGQPAAYQGGDWDPQQVGQQQYDPHPGQQQYPPQQYPAQYGQQQDPYGGWGGAQGGYVQGGYDPAFGAGQPGGAEYVAQAQYGGPAATDPYGMPPVDPYGTAEMPVYQGPVTDAGYPDGYATEQAYPPPQPQHLREHQAPVPPGPQEYAGPGPDPETGWDPGPDQGESAFFSGAAEEEDERERPGKKGRKDGRTRRGDTKKKKNGCACLFVSLVIAGGVGAVGWFGWQFYASHFAPAPDYEGSGTGEVQVDIPDGAALADMGTVLENKGVVKSGGAFVEAANANKKAQGIHPGTYTLRKEMSGASAVDLMLDPSSQNGLIVAEGLRAKAVYQLIDKKIGVSGGTTEKTAKTADLGLPEWAHGKPEGFLFPSKYSVGKNAKPADVLRQMVKRAEAEYARVGLEAAAKKHGTSPRKIITVASLIQAEAQQKDEFGKVSRVIYNRIDQNMALGFDSTINYALGRSTLNTSTGDTQLDSPYNTYKHKGLPPGPIDNPGHQAIEAALKPTKGNWLYFVTVKAGDTRFTASKAQHDRNVQEFNREQRQQQ
ncbi:endolytic transglycosylase MltG [Streptomyces sp. ODS28]|uniref:endolytic transglycosylase MltG n=1 Tax=Streptomyces sp. ODS28 TaxID=3136688 RepID=UPI0031EB2F3F